MFALGSGAAAASTLKPAIKEAQQLFNGEAIEAEAYSERGRRLVEIEIISGSLLYEAVFDANTAELIESEAYGNPRRIARVMRATDRARISLLRAIRITEKELGPGRVLEAELRVQRRADRNGRRYLVEYRTSEGEFDVVINSRTGKVIRIRRD